MFAIVCSIQNGRVVIVSECVSWRKGECWEISSMGLPGHRDENTRASHLGDRVLATCLEARFTKEEACAVACMGA